MAGTYKLSILAMWLPLIAWECHWHQKYGIDTKDINKQLNKAGRVMLYQTTKNREMLNIVCLPAIATGQIVFGVAGILI